MVSESAIPFFVYKKKTKEAFFIVLKTSDGMITKFNGVTKDEQRSIQESESSWVSRHVVGA